MTRFNFRFQKILDLKENETQLAQVEMAEALKKEQAVREQSEALHSKITQAEEMKKAKEQKDIPISELRMLEEYIHQLYEQSSMANREVATHERIVSRSQDALKEKAREEKTWGNLKEQNYAAHQKENQAAEQNFFDDLAGSRYYRLGRTGDAQ